MDTPHEKGAQAPKEASREADINGLIGTREDVFLHSAAPGPAVHITQTFWYSSFKVFEYIAEHHGKESFVLLISRRVHRRPATSYTSMHSMSS